MGGDDAIPRAHARMGYHIITTRIAPFVHSRFALIAMPEQHLEARLEGARRTVQWPSTHARPDDSNPFFFRLRPSFLLLFCFSHSVHHVQQGSLNELNELVPLRTHVHKLTSLLVFALPSFRKNNSTRKLPRSKPEPSGHAISTLILTFNFTFFELGDLFERQQ